MKALIDILEFNEMKKLKLGRRLGVSEKIEKTLWVNSTSLSEINGHSYIPTTLLYKASSKPIFGVSEELFSESGCVNKNFKIDLGDVVPGSAERVLFDTGMGVKKSAYELTKDYLDGVLGEVEKKNLLLPEDDFKIPAKIIVAEPLGFQVEGRHKNWISNYRENIRRILNRYEEIDFLPEPFAVYQYYRYGLRIPSLADNAKHVALILDFGGGTFDVCVIESNSNGDISQSGKHSKPLSSASTPVGGFVINSEIAEYLIKRDLDGPDRKKADYHIERYNRVKKGILSFEDLREESRVFIQNLSSLEARAEKYKIDLVGRIADWRLSSEAYEKISIELPKDPFSSLENYSSEFYAHQLRDVFVKKIWNSELKETVDRTLARAKEELKGKGIGVTLISGGSSNIRWLTHLLCKDFEMELGEAIPVSINTSFQEIVAKGLAIECARRFYNHDSEFVAVTYNPIKLLLNPDDHGIDGGRRYKSIGDVIDMKDAKDGDLIPVAQSLRHFIGKPLKWRVKLSHPPKHNLKYFFIRPGGEGVSDCYNPESSVVFTRDAKFDAHIHVELTINETGTAFPKFIYRAENKQAGAPECSEEGRPFALDMTTGIDSKNNSSQYIGLDFGTSSSSICRLSNSDIQLTARRSSSSGWRGLSESLPNLPYPIAFCLRKYLDVKNSEKASTCARELFESCLAFMAYCAASELLLVDGAVSAFANFQHRSMGPLRGLIEAALTGLGEKADFSKPYRVVLKEKRDFIDNAINDFNENKHDKKSDESFDFHAHIEEVVSLISASMVGKKFGFAATCESVPFQDDVYRGLFKVAHDNQPFVSSFSYESPKQFGREQALLVNCETGRALNFMPLMFWMERSGSSTPYSCYLLDKFESNSGVLVKPCDLPEVVSASSLDPHLEPAISRLRDKSILKKNYTEINLHLESED